MLAKAYRCGLPRPAKAVRLWFLFLAGAQVRHIWQRQIETFAKTGHVISFDPRSQGESTKTTSGNTPEMCAGPPAAVHNLSGRNSQANFLGKISPRCDEIFHCAAGWNRPRQIEQTERQHSCEISALWMPRRGGSAVLVAYRGARR
jgi:hypothetical protein